MKRVISYLLVVIGLSGAAFAGIVNPGGATTAAGVGLGNVTNDTQTKAAIVPNTAPSSGQIPIGNAGGTAYAPQTLSGNGFTFSLSNAGVISISGLNITSIADGTDPTKLLNFDIHNFTTGTTKTILFDNNGAVDPTSGGTGVVSATAYAPLFGGTTSTGPFQSGTVGTAGQVMTSNGAGTLPTFQALPAGGVTTVSPLSGTTTISLLVNVDFSFTNLQSVTINALATATANAVAAKNTTVATSGSKDQYSPAYDWLGHIYYSSADHTVEFRSYIATVSGGGQFARFIIESRFDNGSWGNQFIYDTVGGLTAAGGLTGSSLTLNVGAGIVTSNGSVQNLADGNHRFSNAAQTGFETIVANPGSPKVGGAIFAHYADTSTTHTDGTEDDLYSDTLAAGTLAANGDSAQKVEHVQFVSSATASRRLKQYFGGTLIFDSGSLTLSLGGDFTVITTVVRESSSVVRCDVAVTSTSASSIPYSTYTRITSLTLSNTQVMKTTGIASGTGAASGDVVCKMSKTTWSPSP